jgi:hypothetical protein
MAGPVCRLQGQHPSPRAPPAAEERAGIGAARGKGLDFKKNSIKNNF